MRRRGDARDMTYNPFYDYQKERNALKSGARHRKCGSKTKYVSLPHDPPSVTVAALTGD